MELDVNMLHLVPFYFGACKPLNILFIILIMGECYPLLFFV